MIRTLTPGPAVVEVAVSSRDLHLRWSLHKSAAVMGLHARQEIFSASNHWGSLITGLDSSQECGTGRWDWNVGLHFQLGRWNGTWDWIGNRLNCYEMPHSCMVGQKLGILIRSGTSLNSLRIEPQVHSYRSKATCIFNELQQWWLWRTPGGHETSFEHLTQWIRIKS